jgi:acetyl esterase/lipase
MLQADAPPSGSPGIASPIASSAASVAALARATAQASSAAQSAGSATTVPTAAPAATLAPLLALPPRDVSAPVSSAYQSSGYSEVDNVPFTGPVDCGGYFCRVELDIYVPAGTGPFPTVVLVRGGPGGPDGRGYLDPFAGDLANQGILVYNADFRDIAGQGGGYPNGFEDVACAIRYARADASQFGGNASPITLVGHSLGGWVGSVVALDQKEFGGFCLAGGSGRPDAFVGLAGNYQISAGYNASDLYTFFGGSLSGLPAAYGAGNPFNYATGSSIPVRLVAGTGDGTVDPAQSVALNAFLVQQGWNVTLTMIPDGTHMSILGEQSTYDAIFSAIAAASSIDHSIDPVEAQSGR